MTRLPINFKLKMVGSLAYPTDSTTGQHQLSWAHNYHFERHHFYHHKIFLVTRQLSRKRFHNTWLNGAERISPFKCLLGVHAKNKMPKIIKKKKKFIAHVSIKGFDIDYKFTMVTDSLKCQPSPTPNPQGAPWRGGDGQ